MSRISSFYGIIILMYYDDHNPPHFHARYAEFEALIGIMDFKILRGSLPSKAQSLVIEWAAIHQQDLLNDWKLMEEEKPLLPIEPLI